VRRYGFSSGVSCQNVKLALARQEVGAGDSAKVLDAIRERHAGSRGFHHITRMAKCLDSHCNEDESNEPVEQYRQVGQQRQPTVLLPH